MTNTWTPETNCIPTGLLTDEEKAALRACKHGWERFNGESWMNCHFPSWQPDFVYRAKPEPKRLVTWHNVYASGRINCYHISRADADRYASRGRLCVYRIERNEDGSNPELVVEEV